MSNPPTVFILSLSSDIGTELAQRYLTDGWRIIGTYRHSPVAVFNNHPNVQQVCCDISDAKSIFQLSEQFRANHWHWSLMISSVGTLEPIGSFTQANFRDWESSVLTNSTRQLAAFHSLYEFRAPCTVSLALFAGGGTNGTFTNYSSYCLGKIALMKMCELLDDECPDLNPFILGTGWVKTKIHQQTLSAGLNAGINHERTQSFLDHKQQGTSHDDIFACIEWCRTQGKAVAGGRNFSIAHDPWREGGLPLIQELTSDSNMYKLRRYKNT